MPTSIWAESALLASGWYERVRLTLEKGLIAGVDMAGVHLWGNSLDSADVSYQSSAIAAIDSWKSPVLIWHNDDDRNVDFAQTIGLVDLLRARNVYYELIVNPDDTHETLLHSRWLYTFARMQDFLQRFVWNKNLSSSR